MLQKFEVTIKGISPIIMHDGAKGLDNRSPAKVEIAEISKKRGTNLTVVEEERRRELECQVSIWEKEGKPTIPETAIRACIENGARKLKQGPQVREGMIVDHVKTFEYDRSLGDTVEELGKTVQYTVPVVVQKSRIERTRAKFDTWSCTFVLDTDDELVDQDQLETWLDIAGRRIGLGDWRPQKSGHFGRFEVKDIAKVE